MLHASGQACHQHACNAADSGLGAGCAFGGLLTGSAFALVCTLAFFLGFNAFGWNGVMLSQIATLAPSGRVADATGGMQFVMFGGIVVFPASVAGAVSLSGGYGVLVNKTLYWGSQNELHGYDTNGTHIAFWAGTRQLIACGGNRQYFVEQSRLVT